MAESMLSTSKQQLTSSEDEDADCMPKIVTTISLQGCSDVTFKDEPEDEDTGLLYPQCEIKEEKSGETDKKPEHLRDNGLPSAPKEKEEEKSKKRVKLKLLPSVKQERGLKSKPSTSRQNDSYNVVDARRLALQESLFKTKELFDTFLRVCQDQENCDEMQRVVEKLSRAYGNTRQEYLGSLEFQNILESETEKVNSSNNKPWLSLKLVLDEMKHNKILSKSKLKLGDSDDSQDARAGDEDETFIECPKKRRHLKKLEKSLRALNLKIKKLEEKEVDFEDDDSAYVKLDRYRAQFTRVYNKVCEIKGKLPDADRPYLRKVSFAGTTYPHINRCIERYYNKHREFPDFQDIKKLVTIANEQEKLQMPPVKIHQMAAAAFKEFGEMLKRLRQYDDYDVIISYLDQQVDPARDDEELREQLTKNALLFKKKEQEVIDKFANEDLGINSESGGNSENKPKKKKRKILMTGPRKNPPSPAKKHLSSSDESSDEEEKEVKNDTKYKPGPSLSSSGSDSSCSEDEDEKVKEKPAVGKGKALIGKNRIIKRGAKQSSPKKKQMSRPAISSDEESSPKNPKDTLTNYLGLQVTPSKSETEVTKVKEESDDEVTIIKNNSDSGNTIKKKSGSPLTIIDKPKSSGNMQKDTTIHKPSIESDNEMIDDDSSCGSEPIAIVEKIVAKSESLKEQPLRRTFRRTRDGKTEKNITDDLSSSENSDDSDEESDKSEQNKCITDVELSSDSSDSEKKEEKVEERSPVDEPIVILSEDVVEVASPINNGPARNQSSGNSSESDDDICILSSQDSTRPGAVVPRKTSPEPVKNSFKRSTLNNNSPGRPPTSFGTVKTPPGKRTTVATSTSIQKAGATRKRQLNLRLGGTNKKPRNGSQSDGSVNGHKQLTLPQVINGAGRKTIISKVSQDEASSSPESIPLIELD